MLTTLRAKLTAIVVVAATTFLLLIGVSSVLAARVGQKLTSIQQQYLPKLELGPKLDADFSALRRTLQDAVAARDADALDETRTQYAAFLQHLQAAHGALDATEASALESGFEDYYSSARDVSRRMIAGETGEGLVSAMRMMQAKQTQAAQLLQKAVAFDRSELVLAFAGATRAEETAGKLRLGVSLACLLFVIGLSWWLSRGVLRALDELSAGLERVGRADFERPIVVHGSDELAELAVRANQMAENLRRLHEERERADWLRAGRVGLAEELRGELSLDELGARAVRFLARYLEAPLGALYYLDGDRVLRLAGTYGLGGAHGQHAAAPSFRLGEGLLGQACLTAELTVLHNPPGDFLRARSALGEGAPSVLAFLPLSHAGSVTGALELGIFGAWSERFGELLGSVGETLAIAIEVARARTAMNDLLAETQRQAERLAAQEEELQASNEMLHSQQEELRQTNEELTQQASALEAQQLVLQGKNTALDQASRHLRQKAEELTRISTYKSQFLANMSHELRTPLNSMLLLSSLLADNQDGNLSRKQVEYCKTIHSSGKDLLGLINQVLDLAKVEAGKQELRLETLTLAWLVDHAERVFRPLASDKHLEFRVSLDPSLPESIVTDQQRIQQIVNNLLANAIKFTLVGSVSFEIRRVAPGTSFHRPDLQLDQALALSVTDTGVGIAPEHQGRIFAPFEQVEAASDRRFGGTGLGLTIAREMAQLLGGELSLSSVPGKGSTFVCHLPFQAPAKALVAAPNQRADLVTKATSNPAPATPAGAPATPAPAAPAAADLDSAAPPGTSDAYLLVVEDDAVFAETFGEVIRRQGLKFERVATGQAALELCRKRPPSGIILDVQLPDRDGWQIMDALRKDPLTAAIPVHFVSAADAAERARELGAIGYLTKPATHQELGRVVEALAARAADPSRNLLFVDRDGAPADSLLAKLSSEPFQITRATTLEAALAALDAQPFLCTVVNLALADGDGLGLVRKLSEREAAPRPPLVVYSERPLSKSETIQMAAFAEAIILKEGSSGERLLDEVRVFVRRLKSGWGTQRVSNALGSGPRVRLDGRRVLVVDDDMRTAYALSATLRANGADVVVADTGEAALGVLSKQLKVDAVLMDMMMPEMDGYETMRRIRHEMRLDALPIIALTAKAMKDDRDRCLEFGASDYLPKPIDPERLLALLNASLTSKPDGMNERPHDA